MSGSCNAPGVYVVSAYVATFGADAALLLSQIRYWFHLAKKGKSYCVVERQGTKWVAHSRKQYREETGLPLTRIRRALERLQGDGVISIEQHLFGGKNVSHITLAPDYLP